MSKLSLPVEHLATLYEITRKLNSSLDLDEVLHYVMDRVIDVTGAERGFLMLLDDKTGEFTFQVARGIDRTHIEQPQFKVSRTILRQVQESGQPILTDNAQQLFSSTESVILMALRSIMCVPITVREKMIGLVYVDNRTHTGIFEEDHLLLLTAFASQAGTAIENARLYRIAVEQGRMQRELEMAQTIQRGLLPVEFPVLAGYDVAVYWQSAREVAGDFYDCILLGQEMGVVIGDVSDKGAPAAIFMAMVRSLIRGSAVQAQNPEDVLKLTNRLILTDTSIVDMFVTVYYAVFEPEGAVSCINAGHNLPLLWRARDGSVEFLPRGGHPLGWFEDMPLQTLNYQLEPGDIIVFYTDGITEAENGLEDFFGEERLAEVVQQAAGHATAQQLIDLIDGAVRNFMGATPPFDDRTMVVVRYIGA
ncbi:MAG: SpoIIE family protein phosphatase [Anaerolineae bacterium]|nr:SpoIIE family protein phosphatase [Anaerolineae bacterium]